MEHKTEYLNAIYQNTKTALQSISDIISKVEDTELVGELNREQELYEDISTSCELFAREHGIEDIKDNNWFEKARLWTSINMGTMTDKSTRKIAEMMLLGTFMGIITCEKDKDDHKNVSNELDKLIDKLLQLERDNIEKLLPFLRENSEK